MEWPSWITPSVLAPIITAIIAIIGLIPVSRRYIMSWFCPVSLVLSKEAIYCNDLTGEPNIDWYTASFKMKIKPRCHINIDDFYVKLNIGDKEEKVGLSFITKDKYGDAYNITIGEGYRLEPHKPIGPTNFAFRFMVRNKERIDKEALIILKVGIRQDKFPIKKSIVLREET